MRTALAAVVGLVLAGCATRRPEVVPEAAPVAATTVWRVEEGDVLQTKVFRSPDLSADPTVGADGSAFFPALGRVHVAGLALDSLERVLNARYATLLRGEPSVQVTMLREITLYGQIRVPGVYAAGPGTTLLGLLARAGGPIGGVMTPAASLQTSDGRRLTLPGEARLGAIDLHRSDAIYLSERSFFLRNSTTIGAASLIVSTLTALMGVVLLVSR